MNKKDKTIDDDKYENKYRLSSAFTYVHIPKLYDP